MLKEWINPAYGEEPKKKELGKNCKEAKPFPHLVLPNFFNEEKLRKIKQTLEQETFFERNADLYEFKQTEDFKSTTVKELQDLYNFFLSKDFAAYIEQITGTKIESGSIDMSAFLYTQTEYFLPHDDQLEGRKVAYVINLSEGFTEEDGGRLQLFATEEGKPTRVVKSYVPTFNTLVLFHVTPESFHQIEEVQTEKERIGITGWFHGH